MPPLAPEEILDHVLALDPALTLVPYYGELSIFYNPGGAAPLGVILVSVKERDGPNDRRSRLDRDGVYRFALGLRPDTFAGRFGAVPPRPPKGGAVDVLGHDPSRVGALSPHPVYAWMSWAQILSPTRRRFDALAPLIGESLDLARGKWERNHAHRGH